MDIYKEMAKIRQDALEMHERLIIRMHNYPVRYVFMFEVDNHFKFETSEDSYIKEDRAIEKLQDCVNHYGEDSFLGAWVIDLITERQTKLDWQDIWEQAHADKRASEYEEPEWMEHKSAYHASVLPN